ncbi:MAG: hypothetical protein VYB44_07425 [Bacteroidota bacterium]|nr:hypothetical protein [Bacteroidota bacterium]
MDTSVEKELDIEVQFMSMLNEIAQRWAEKFGYQNKEDIEYNPSSDFHPISQVTNQPMKHVNYKGETRGSYINTRQRFGNPTIDISAPSQEWFVGLEFNKGKIKQCQIFYEKGFEMMPIIKQEIEDQWQSILVAKG